MNTIFLNSYFAGKRQYRTDGAMLMIEPIEELHEQRMKKIPKTIEETLSHYKDKAPVTLGVDYLREILDATEAGAVSIYMDGKDEVVLFVFSENEFVLLMPTRKEIQYPALTEEEQRVVAQSQEDSGG